MAAAIAERSHVDKASGDLLIDSRDGTSRRLVVVIHGSNPSTTSRGRVGLAKSMSLVSETIDREMSDADQYVPNLPIGRFSFQDPVQVNRDLVNAITSRFVAKNYDSVTLVGHSLGGLVARRAYVTACGQNPDAPFHPDSPKEIQPWAGKVDRIILLAGVNQGWSISHHMKRLKTLKLTMGVWLGYFLWAFGWKPLIFEMRRGARSVTLLRIHWLSMRRAFEDSQNEKTVGGAAVVQLVGTIDDLVSPADAVDPISGADFLYISVPNSSHEDMIEMDGTPIGQERSRLFGLALKERLDVLEIDSLPPVDDTITQDKTVDKVIFVIHGIRDEGYWTQKVAAQVKKLGLKAKPPQRFVSVTSSYGYLTMLPFLLPWVRRDRVEWLMNEYAMAFARFPNAKFSYVGHSNGTYLLAKALDEYHACQFERVAFAGSVVRSTYDWKSIVECERVKEILNYVATADWVVAWFPNLFELIRIQDLGGAGHRGFTAKGPKISEVRYVAGDHGAAIREERWQEIARFIVDGDQPAGPHSTTKFPARQSWIVRGLGFFPPIVWIALLSLLVMIGFGVVFVSGFLAPAAIPFGIIVVLIYIWAVLQILMRA